ncbi:MAG: hypothetical protein EA371_06565 [Gammaproteobacteria bacterium]|nr:MAG: hypothetical protein EA371_06565 [Gammaproteobacteria bacterium]
MPQYLQASRHFLGLSCLCPWLLLAAESPASPFDADALWRGAEAGLDLAACPSFGETRLTAIEQLAPITVPLLAGGDVDAAELSGDCQGRIAAAPDYRVHLEDATSHLDFSFAADVSGVAAMLIINRPDGRWSCSPAASDTVSLQLDSATAGQYDIWIGTATSDTWLPGTLTIASPGARSAREADR